MAAVSASADMCPGGTRTWGSPGGIATGGSPGGGPSPRREAGRGNCKRGGRLGGALPRCWGRARVSRWNPTTPRRTSWARPSALSCAGLTSSCARARTSVRSARPGVMPIPVVGTNRSRPGLAASGDAVQRRGAASDRVPATHTQGGTGPCAASGATTSSVAAATSPSSTRPPARSPRRIRRASKRFAARSR